MKPIILNEEALLRITVRQRAILKLYLGGLPLSPDELCWVLPHKQADAVEVKSRSLREVALFFGISKERVRQISTRSLIKMGLFSETAE